MVCLYTVINHSIQLSNSSVGTVVPSSTATSTVNAAPNSIETSNSVCTNSVAQSDVITTTIISNIQLSAVTVTVTVTPQPSISVQTVLITPSVQQQISSSDDNNCNTVAICIPVMIVIAIIVTVVVFIAIWRLKRCRKVNLGVTNPQLAHVDNDLYG